MNVLVVGRGGREHAIVMKLKESKRVENIFVAPGNGGMKKHATCIAIDEMDIDQLVTFAKENKIGLTIVGPENPLNAGIANRFTAEGLAVFAPTEEAALLEGSKSFAKDFMEKYEIPTAAYATFSEAEAAKAYIAEKGAPIVIKADGLAEGKGVVVAETEAEAMKAIDEMMIEKRFQAAGSTIVIEEFLAGVEYSLMAFVDGHNIYPMMTARDHKRAYDQDAGPNTGGMGAFAPVPDITAESLAFSTKEILQRAADGLVAEGRSFTGILYAGLMETAAGPKVIEFNTRFGDPETQVVLPLLENDLVQVMEDVLAGKNPELIWKDAACLGVVVASTGYPGAYEKGIPLPAVDDTEECFVIQAGTKETEAGVVSNGGRVLLVGATGETLASAQNAVYTYLKAYEGNDAFFYRTDIGKSSI